MALSRRNMQITEPQWGAIEKALEELYLVIREVNAGEFRVATEEPSGPEDGQFWIDRSGASPVLKVWNADSQEYETVTLS